MKNLSQAFGQIKAVLLKPYYLILFSYHMRMYKRAVRSEDKSVDPKKDGGERDGS